MAHESRSYYDDYIRSKAVLKHCGDENAKTLLTDRNAYISFLEVQLERVSAACLTTQTFERRLAELESVQTTNDQKLGSLSKVFRLNQEYVEHTSTQAQTELAAHAAKVDAWMEKFSAELERQQPRMATLEEQFQHCQDFLPRLTEANDAALHDMKRQTEHEIEEMKALIYALETRIEEIQTCQTSTDRKLNNLTDTATHKLDRRKRMLAALEDIGDKLQLDAGATTENTLQAAHAASESHFSHVMEFTTTLENRLRILEYTVWSLKVSTENADDTLSRLL
ncbi:hypothetical protein PHYBOEH_001859 [Phytophthora boehmeriae]|uniref:Uncharacterized protein n=1 Tax=Phytophthora boehmeriae TaxID=109152 RepID=A0A8T1WT93_9STRA|nr:hypothetical protein PHYBOEH_001859 [Phytophthora boehmeriae]